MAIGVWEFSIPPQEANGGKSFFLWEASIKKIYCFLLNGVHNPHHCFLAVAEPFRHKPPFRPREEIRGEVWVGKEYHPLTHLPLKLLATVFQTCWLEGVEEEEGKRRSFTIE